MREKNKLFVMRVSDDDRREFAELAKARHVSVAEAVRIAVKAALQAKEQQPERLQPYPGDLAR